MPVTAGCHRQSIDFPEDLYDLLRERAATPPPVSVSEYIRRLVAYHLNYDLPSLDERVVAKLRLDGKNKMKPGPKKGHADDAG